MTFEQIICLAKYYYGKKLQSSIICKSYLKCNLKAMPIKIFILPCVKNFLGYIFTCNIRKALERIWDYLTPEKASEFKGLAYSFRKYA